MSEIIERAARAAYEKFNEGLIPSLEPAWCNLSPDFRDRLVEAHRAAIEAIREPSAAMIKAGDLRLIKMTDYSVPGLGESGATSYRRMIDEALK